MVFEFTDGRTRLYQWDSDVILAFPELADGTEVHFAASSSMSIKRTVADGVAMIPNVLLQRNRNILMFVFRDDTTVDEGEIEVVGRPKPPDYVYTDQEVLTWQMHDWRIEDLESKLPVYVSLSMSGGKYTADKTVAELEEAYQNGCDLYCMCPYNGKTYKLPLRIRGDEFTWTFAGVTDGLSLTVTDFANIVAVEAARCVYNVNGVAPDAYGRVEVLNSKAFYVAVTNASGKYTADKTVTAIEAAYQRNDSIYCLCDFGGEIYTLPLWNRAAPTVWMFSNAGDGNEVNVIITGDVVTVFSRQAVKTVNGQKPNSAGAVTVAIPEKVSDLQNDSGFITGAAVSEHNTATTSHNDIRQLINGLTNRLNALANSDDTTLDQMAEVVSYIKSNRTLIESITTGKVNVSDIVDNLTTNVSNKPLSAAQGVALKKLIDAITIPTTLPNPNALTFTGAASGSYDGSGAKTVNIPTVPSALPNPKALTINGQSYDGSEEVKITIEGGSGTGGSSEIYDTRKDIPEPVTITVGTDPEMTLTLVDGKEYTVSYDGKDYTCTAHAYDWGIALGFDAYDSVGNHEPFYLIQWVDAGETGWILEHWNKTSGDTVEWSICEGALKKLDYKYLDYGIREAQIGTAEGIAFTESTDENGVTYSGSSTSKEAMGLDYADLVVGEKYNVYIGEAKYVMACGVSEDAADGDTVRVLTEVYPGLNKYASVVVYQPTSTNDVQIQCYAMGGTYPVRICKEVIETIPEELLPEGIGSGGGGTSDAVQYTPQTPTEEQQMRARENLGLYRKTGAMVELMPETTQAPDENTGGIAMTFVPEAGKTYIVNWNGTTYECLAYELTMEGITGIVFGNSEVLANFGITAEKCDAPFAASYVPEQGGSLGILDESSLDESGNVTLSVYCNDTTIHPIEPEFLPNGVPYVVEGEATDTLTFDGNLEGKEAIPFGDGAYMVKVSSATPSTEELVGATIKLTSIGAELPAEQFTLTADGIINEAGLFYMLADPTSEAFGGGLVPADFSMEGVSASAGIYLFYASDGYYASSLTATSKIFGEPDTINKLDPRCLPDGAGAEWTASGLKEGYSLVTCPERTVAFAEGAQQVTLADFSLAGYSADVTYTVLWNGVRYDCSPYVVGSGTDGAYAYLGNQNILNSNNEDTGEPFVFVWMEISTTPAVARTATDTAAKTVTFSIGIWGEGYETLPKQYFPTFVPWVTNAEANQVVKVKSVNEYGMPVEWGAEDAADYVTTGGTGAYYSAKVPGITELVKGVGFTMVPNVGNTTTKPQLDVNGLGKVTIRRRLSNGTTAELVRASSTDGTSADLKPGCPVRTVYDGTYWVAELAKPVASDLYGNIETDFIILKSSTEGSTKKFRVTIDDTGTLTPTEIT